MIYTQVTTEYKYQVIAEAIYSRELEHFHYNFDRVNFERLIAGTQDEDYKSNLLRRLSDTQKQIENVEAIYEALLSQIDNQEAYSEAVKRVTEKRASEVKFK